MDLILNGTGNGTGSVAKLVSSLEARLGVFQTKFSGTTTASATVVLYDGWNNAPLGGTDGTHILSTATTGKSTNVLVPWTFYAVVSGSAGAFTVSAAVAGVEE